jgi:CelD/BcsL family acetyltransferase involved in cellulose biosynthesis
MMAYLDQRGGWSVLDLRNCPPGMLGAQPAHLWVRQAGVAHGWDAQVAPADQCRVLALPAGFDAYLGTLSGNTRQQIRRKLRKLGEAGITIAPVDPADTASLAATLEQLFHFHQARWGSDPSGGSFPDERARAQNRYLAAQLAARGELDLRVARAADGTCLGVMYNFRRDGVGYFVILGLNPDPQWQAYSVGTCLLASSIAAAIEAGCHTFDLLRGEHDYKRHFGGEVRANLRVTIYRYRWLPMLAEAGRGLLRRLRGPAPQAQLQPVNSEQ